MNRTRASTFAVLLFLAVNGCINVPDIEPEGPEEPLPDLGVQLRTPAATTYTNGAVGLSVEVTNGTPEAVELFVGDELLATLPSPYTFTWDTTSKPEGTYTLKAKARRGAQTFTSEGRDVVVDRTPPQVVLRTPSPGAQDVSVHQSIQVAFSEPLAPRAMDDTRVHLLMQTSESPIELAKTLSLSADGTVLTIIPSSKPNAPNEFFITLDALTDRAGNSLSALGAWNWKYPAWLSMGGALSRLSEEGGTFTSPAESPALALDVRGNPAVAWLEKPTTRQSPDQAHVFVQRWKGIGWEPIADAATDSWGSAFAGPPALDLDNLDRPLVSWFNVGGVFVFITRWEGRWQEMGRLRKGAAVASRPSLQLDGGGNPWVVWAQDDQFSSFPPPTSDAFLGKWNGTEWVVTERLQANPESQTSVRDAVVKYGRAAQSVVAWGEAGSSGHIDIYVGRISAGGWTAVGGALSARPGMTAAVKPSLQLDVTGNPIVAWKEFNEGGNSSNLYVQRWSGTQWERLGDAVNAGDSIAEVDDPALALDASGNPILAWTGNDGNTTNIYVHRWADGQWVPWGGPLSANPGKTGAAHPSLRIDSEGVPVVAWDESEELPSNKQTRNVYVYRANK